MCASFTRSAYKDVVENIGAFVNGKPIRILTPEKNFEPACGVRAR